MGGTVLLVGMLSCSFFLFLVLCNSFLFFHDLRKPFAPHCGLFPPVLCIWNVRTRGLPEFF